MNILSFPQSTLEALFEDDVLDFNKLKQSLLAAEPFKETIKSLLKNEVLLFELLKRHVFSIQELLEIFECASSKSFSSDPNPDLLSMFLGQVELFKSLSEHELLSIDDVETLKAAAVEKHKLDVVVRNSELLRHLFCAFSVDKAFAESYERFAGRSVAGWIRLNAQTLFDAAEYFATHAIEQGNFVLQSTDEFDLELLNCSKISQFVCKHAFTEFESRKFFRQLRNSQSAQESLLELLNNGVQDSFSSLEDVRLFISRATCNDKLLI